ncbi:hypothetical protein PIB30_065840 [Stylosanthes scabra]|uniref:Uncharacterized protein n=1 Tax=Stylosanthes scabra TaxID=79078 RepID=A0ABU6SM97_9FABA|nr:hypothetical protein [Stylosanthes scabra]
MIDASSGGALMNKTPEEACEMIETVADANRHFSTRAKSRGVHEVAPSESTMLAKTLAELVAIAKEIKEAYVRGFDLVYKYLWLTIGLGLEKPWESCSRRAGRPDTQNHTQASQSRVASNQAPRISAQAPRITPRHPSALGKHRVLAPSARHPRLGVGIAPKLRNKVSDTRLGAGIDA